MFFPLTKLRVSTSSYILGIPKQQLLGGTVVLFGYREWRRNEPSEIVANSEYCRSTQIWRIYTDIYVVFWRWGRRFRWWQHFRWRTSTFLNVGKRFHFAWLILWLVYQQVWQVCTNSHPLPLSSCASTPLLFYTRFFFPTITHYSTRLHPFLKRWHLWFIYFEQFLFVVLFLRLFI